MTSKHPDWFTYALDQPYESREIDHDGVRITYRAWGKSGASPVVLVHGGGPQTTALADRGAPRH